MIGFLVGFLIAIKPAGERGILRNSDTLPFVLGMGLLFVMIITRFCDGMDRGSTDTRPGQSEPVKPFNIRKLFSILVGMVGVGLMVVSFLRTFKILAR